MKAARRKQLVNELRSAHFFMGFDKKPQFDSEYKQEYTEHPLDFGLQSKNLRKTNFELGQDNDQKLYSSLMKNDFLKPLEYTNAGLSSEILKDLRQHHFTLGSDNIIKLSESKEQFNKKKIDPSAFTDRKQLVNELRRHKHNFGDDQNYYSSIYDKNYNTIKELEIIGQPKTKDEINKQIIELRKTNLVIGSQTPQYVTMSQQCFPSLRKQEKPLKFDINLKRSHFELGREEIAYKTTVQDQFYKKDLIPNKLDQNLVKDLRTTHFSIGNEKLNYESETLDKFQGKPLEYKAGFDKQKYYRGCYQQGDPDLKNIYTSSYVTDFDKTQPAKARYLANGEHIKQWDANKLQATTFGIGNDQPEWISEHRENFIGYPNAEKPKLEEKTKEDLRRHHAEFGIDANNWETEHQATYQNKFGPRNSMPVEMLQDLRRQHFVYGYNNNNYQVSSETIGRQKGLPAKLDEKLTKELRTHHFVENMDNHDYNTIYKEQYVWKTSDEQ